MPSKRTADPIERASKRVLGILSDEPASLADEALVRQFLADAIRQSFGPLHIDERNLFCDTLAKAREQLPRMRAAGSLTDSLVGIAKKLMNQRMKRQLRLRSAHVPHTEAPGGVTLKTAHHYLIRAGDPQLLAFFESLKNST